MSSTKAVPRSRYRFARYGPTDHYEDAPAAGMCMSVFVIARRPGKKGILLGLPKPDEKWSTEWISAWKTYSEKELTKAYNEWRLPSSYLREGEHPEEAVRRIMEDQVLIGDYSLSKKGTRIYSYNSPSDWYQGNNHWDLAFVYDVKVRGKGAKELQTPKWWRELEFVKKKKDFLTKDYGWNEDFMMDILDVKKTPPDTKAQ